MRALCWRVLCVGLLVCGSASANNIEPLIRSHEPMRPLPTKSDRPLGTGPTYFVEPVNGMDRNDGTKPAPWKTINHAVQQLKSGDTLCLRGGTYFESVTVAALGTAEKPITIRAFPGEVAVLDAGLREFLEAPTGVWEPAPGGAAGRVPFNSDVSVGRRLRKLRGLDDPVSSVHELHGPAVGE